MRRRDFLLCSIGAAIYPHLAHAQVTSRTRIAKQSEGDELFTISSLNTWRDGRFAFDTSDSGLLRYQTPRYNLEAHVVCKKENLTRNWKTGFVQVLMKSRIVHDYEGGHANGWAFPRLPVSDSTGTEYPWYAGNKGYARGWGTANLYMDDYFTSKVGWHLTRRGGSIDRTSRLTRISRNQAFRVWVMALDEAGETIYPLRELNYSIDCQIKADPDARSAESIRFDLTEDRNNGISEIDIAWLQGPTANDSQYLVEAAP